MLIACYNRINVEIWNHFTMGAGFGLRHPISALLVTTAQRYSFRRKRYKYIRHSGYPEAYSSPLIATGTLRKTILNNV